MAGWPRMVPVLLSLAASSCWGVADFLGGLQSKRVPVAVVLCVVEGAGLVGVLVDHRGDRGAVPRHAGGRSSRLVAGRRRRHRAGLLLPGAGHRDDEHRGADQRHRGRAPGAWSASRPATGSSTIVAVGLAVTVVGVAARLARAARRRRAGRGRQAQHRPGAGGGGRLRRRTSCCPTPPPTTRCCGCWRCRALIPVPRWRSSRGARGMRPPPARTRGSSLVAAGTLDCGATALYAWPTRRARSASSSVVGSLYPVMTLILARAVLGERIRPRPAGGRRRGAGRRRDDRGGLACSS